MTQVAELGRLSISFAIQPGFWIGCRLVHVVLALLPSKVHLRIASAPIRRAPTILLAEALERSVRFNHRSVHCEVLIRKKLTPSRFLHNFIEELSKDLRFQQSFPILGKRRRIERRQPITEIQEPTKEKVVPQPLTKQPLASDRVERDQDLRLQQRLRR